MSFALSSGVTGLQAHQRMLDVAGNNLSNVNTTAFKASNITFSQLLSQTIKKASQPTATVGGTNPQQMGSGVAVGGITPNMTQGNIVNTNNPLDLAIEGEGFFVLNDGQQNIYTRAGSLAVDSNSNLVDPSNGYVVQRIGSTGEADGFQIPGSANIKVPYDVALPAKATTQVVVAGNLSADGKSVTNQAQVLKSNLAFTTTNSVEASATTAVTDLEQFSGTLSGTGTLSMSGINKDGDTLTVGSTLSVSSATDMQDVLDYINSILSASANQNADGTFATASLVNGEIVMTDGASGYSLSDMNLSYTPSAGGETFTLPSYFEVSTVGGEETKNVNITIFDSQGGPHVLSGTFVRTPTNNVWDMVLTSVTGDVNTLNFDGRRIRGITFDQTDGSMRGITGTDTPTFQITFDHDPSNAQTIAISLGTIGQFDGLTQFAGASTAVTRDQDGYEAGSLSTVSVNNEGILIGAFSNGIKKNIATLQISLFQNVTGLENIGGGYYTSSANSGEAVATQALTGGAGTIHGGSLEKSNADVATEFVNMIQAQNGFQASARTIKVANDILRELASLIR